MINLDVVLAEVKQAIQNRADQSFITQQDPITHRNWSPLKAASLKAKRPSMRNKILQNTRVMRAGVHVRIEGNKLKVSNAESYAPFHQFGTQHIPQRRFLPFDDQGKPSPELKADIDHILSPQGRGGQDLARQVANFIFGGVRRRS